MRSMVEGFYRVRRTPPPRFARSPSPGNPGEELRKVASVECRYGPTLAGERLRAGMVVELPGLLVELLEAPEALGAEHRHRPDHPEAGGEMLPGAADRLQI